MYFKEPSNVILPISCLNYIMMIQWIIIVIKNKNKTKNKYRVIFSPIFLKLHYWFGVDKIFFFILFFLFWQKPLIQHLIDQNTEKL